MSVCTLTWSCLRWSNVESVRAEDTCLDLVGISQHITSWKERDDTKAISNTKHRREQPRRCYKTSPRHLHFSPSDYHANHTTKRHAELLNVLCSSKTLAMCRNGLWSPPHFHSAPKRNTPPGHGQRSDRAAKIIIAAIDVLNHANAKKTDLDTMTRNAGLKRLDRKSHEPRWC